MDKKFASLQKVLTVCDKVDEYVAKKEFVNAFAMLDYAIHHDVCKAPDLQQMLLQKTLHCCLCAEDKKKFVFKIIWQKKFVSSFFGKKWRHFGAEYFTAAS
jgi:hypothetical protein